jgi:hypothetical protein
MPLARAARRETLIVVALIALGAWLRLRSLSDMEFKRDEIEVLRLGIKLLADQPWVTWTGWPTHGMESSGRVDNAPLFTWIVASVWAMRSDPIWVARAIALANVVCLYPLFRWCRRHMPPRNALMVLALMAVTPFGVMFSRKIWGQDLLCIGIVIGIWAIEWLRSEKPWRGVVLLLMAFVFLGQLHLSGSLALAVLPIALACQALVDRRKGEPRRPWPRPSMLEIAALIAGALLVLFFWLPYLGYLRQVPSQALGERPTLPGLTLDLFWRVAQQVRPSDVFAFFQPDHDDFSAGLLRRWSFDWSIRLGTPLLIYGVWRWLRRPHALPVVGYWWLAIIAAFSLARIPTHPFYVLVLMPLPLMLAGGAFDGPMPRWVSSALTAWRAAYVVALFLLTLTMQNWLFARGGATVGMTGAYGVPYSIRQQQAAAIVERLANPAPALDAGVPAELECRVPPFEAIWLAAGMDVSAMRAIEQQPLMLCDGFIGPEGGRRYRWILKSRP